MYQYVQFLVTKSLQFRTPVLNSVFLVLSTLHAEKTAVDMLTAFTAALRALQAQQLARAAGAFGTACIAVLFAVHAALAVRQHFTELRSWWRQRLR